VALEFHPIADLFPLLEGDEFEAFKADIADRGQQEKIDIYEGKILDGRNRYRACTELGIKPKTQRWSDDGDPIGFVFRKNMHRLHMSESQRAIVGAKTKPMFEAEAAKRKRAGKKPDLPQNSAEGANGDSRDRAAKLVSVSHFSVDAAEKVLDKGVPELAKMVESRQVAVSAAAEVAELPKAEQKLIVSVGPEAVKVKANERRRERRPKSPQQEARESPEVRWASYCRKIHELLGSVRAQGGMRKLASKWDAKGREQVSKAIHQIVSELRACLVALGEES
jgi:hypothetical protein